MLQKGFLVTVLLLIGSISFAQSRKKLTKEESASLTVEQRLVHETNRKGKHGKKKVSVKEKYKISKKQDRRSRHVKRPEPHKNK